MRRLATLALLVLVVAACGAKSSERTPRSDFSGDPCVAEWNAPENAENRARLAAVGYRVGGVSHWTGEAANAEEAQTGCSFLFHDAATFVSFNGRWDAGSFVWDTGEPRRGSWSPEQEAGGYYSSFLVGDDGTVTLDPEWRPPSPEERAGPLASAPRGGRDGSDVIPGAGPAAVPYEPLEAVQFAGTDEMPPGCSARNVAGLFDHFFNAFNEGDGQALDGFLGADFAYYVHPRNYIDQPGDRTGLVPFLLERHQARESMLLLAVRVDALDDDPTSAEVDVALAFRTPTTLAPHWVRALVNCHDQTLVNVGYRSYGLDLAESEILPHASCPPEGRDAPSGHEVACARVRNLDERLNF